MGGRHAGYAIDCLLLFLFYIKTLWTTLPDRLLIIFLFSLFCFEVFCLFVRFVVCGLILCFVCLFVLFWLWW